MFTLQLQMWHKVERKVKKKSANHFHLITKCMVNWCWSLVREEEITRPVGKVFRKLKGNNRIVSHEIDRTSSPWNTFHIFFFIIVFNFHSKFIVSFKQIIDGPLPRSLNKNCTFINILYVIITMPMHVIIISTFWIHWRPIAPVPLQTFTRWIFDQFSKRRRKKSQQRNIVKDQTGTINAHVCMRVSEVIATEDQFAAQTARAIFFCFFRSSSLFFFCFFSFNK